ncbi:MAG TPA: TIGR04053 family radical SAM/SPASM domain-containing protein [Gaiellaceae bacterium]|nr:TIGR04053 family radical SAM/SPASM domain-containing protein [Gaiellaceae bacterium]
MRTTSLDLDARPILVFWETTKACGLACRHCRAEAIACPAPGELDDTEARRLLDTAAGFGTPPPVLVATGGDVLERAGLDGLIEHARALRLPVALAPSVTPLLTDERVAAMRAAGVKVASISLDGAAAATHDGIRGIPGHHADTLEAIRRLRRHGVVVQVNTVVMRETVDELPTIARLVRDLGASIWELFFLIQVGRGRVLGELSPEENEDVCHFLADASQYGFVVRTVEAPFFRRVVAERERSEAGLPGPLYRRLAAALTAELGEPTARSKAQTKGTRDGRGIVFVGHDGAIHPSGFLPLALGNVLEDDLVEVYRDHTLLRRIRAAEFSGSCGTCAFRTLCGGSRARAYAATGDPLASDPACALVAA